MKKIEWKEIRLMGAVEGTIWMPAQKCWKEFDVWFSDQPNKPFRRHWTGLEDAIDYIENDGDFQSCKVTVLYATVFHHYRTRTIRRTKEIRYQPEIAFIGEE